ncbi:MAG: nicotinate-nucleotide--dimethylbenzimidazole phosphoribosyltransferase [Jatrophihabitantaceae bacterium]
MDLSSLGPDVEWPDSEAGTAVRERLADIPDLGHLAPLAEWWYSVRPRESLERVRGLVVGSMPPAVVTQAADAVGASVRVVGDDEDGVAVADDEIDGGADLLIVAVPGSGADAAIAVSVLTNTEPVKVLARGAAATDPDAWMERAVAVRDARRRCLPLREDPDRLLAGIGSARLAAAAGIVLRAAARRTPVLLDGPVAAAAALVAYEVQPRAVRWWAAADLGPDPLHEIALTRLGQGAILGLGTGFGDGLAGLLAVPVIRAAATFGG